MERQLLAYRSLNGESIAEIIRSTQVNRPYKFQVQKVIELSPAEDGKRRVAICYWLGDIEHNEKDATCGIRFAFDAKSNKLIADPETRNLSDPLLSGETAFNLALGISYGTICGSDPQRKNRTC